MERLSDYILLSEAIGFIAGSIRHNKASFDISYGNEKRRILDNRPELRLTVT